MTAAGVMEERGPKKCGAHARSGKPCAQPAGFGTSHPGFGRCKWHGGSTPTGVKSAERARLATVVPIAVGGFEAIERGLAVVNGLMVALEEKLAAFTGDVEEAGELNATLRLARDTARDLATVGKLAADAGLDERRLRLEEEKLSLLAATLRSVFADPELGMTAERQEVAVRVAARHLRELTP